MSVITYEERRKKEKDKYKEENEKTRFRENHRKLWTTEEENFLRNSNLSTKELAEILHRSISAISTKRTKLGATSDKRVKWTKEDEELLKETSFKDDELAETLGRSLGSIKTKRESLIQKREMKNTRTLHEFTPEEDQLILDRSLTIQELSSKLGVHYSSVRNRRLLLIDRLKGRDEYNKKRFSEDEIEVLRDLSKSDAECSKILNRTQKSVYTKRYRMKQAGLL